MRTIHFFILLTVLGTVAVLVFALPYSLLPLACGLLTAGIALWRTGKETWERAVAAGATVSGVTLGGLVLIIGFMVLNGRITYENVAVVTAVPIQPKLYADSRSPKQKTRIPDANLRCTSNPAGLTFTADIEPHTLVPSPISETIRLEGKGFVPDETLNIFLKGSSQNSLYTLAFNEQVRADGTFSRLELVHV